MPNPTAAIRYSDLRRRFEARLTPERRARMIVFDDYHALTHAGGAIRQRLNLDALLAEADRSLSGGYVLSGLTRNRDDGSWTATASLPCSARLCGDPDCIGSRELSGTALAALWAIEKIELAYEHIERGQNYPGHCSGCDEAVERIEAEMVEDMTGGRRS